MMRNSSPPAQLDGTGLLQMPLHRAESPKAKQDNCIKWKHMRNMRSQQRHHEPNETPRLNATSPGGQGQLQSAQSCVVHPSHLLSTPSETWLDGTNIQPHFTGGTVQLPDSKQTCESDESSTPSLSVSGIQCREVPPNLPLTTGIQSGIEIPRAKAVAAVASLHNLDPQDNPLLTTGIQSDSVALSSKESSISSLSIPGIQYREEPLSSVVYTSKPEIDTRLGRAATGIQGESVSHLPTLPFLPTTDSHNDLPPSTTASSSDSVSLHLGSPTVAPTSQPEIGIQIGRATAGIQSVPGQCHSLRDLSQRRKKISPSLLLSSPQTSPVLVSIREAPAAQEPYGKELPKSIHGVLTKSAVKKIKTYLKTLAKWHVKIKSGEACTRPQPLALGKAAFQTGM